MQRFQRRENLIMYVDNSNVFENAKSFSAVKKGLSEKVQDMNCRLNYHKFLNELVDGRDLLVCKVYGSGLENASFPDCVTLRSFKRSGWNKREKKVDTSLVADSVEDIMVHKDTSGRKLILVSGDGDLCPVVDKAIKYEYNVEVWAFSNSTNNEFTLLKESYPNQVEIKKIDDIFDKITYEVEKQAELKQDSGPRSNFGETNNSLNGIGHRNQPSPKPTGRIDDKDSIQCRWKSFCQQGFKCEFAHSGDEKEIFMEHPDPQKRKVYRTANCRDGEECAKRSICGYAHNVEERRCYICKTTGTHVNFECPKNKRNGVGASITNLSMV